MPCRTAMLLMGHADYPHAPGYLYDCVACERECHCDGIGEMCVHCAITEELLRAWEGRQ